MKFILNTRHSIFLLLLIAGINLSCSEKPSENLQQETAKDAEISKKTDQKIILFFGNSLTAGYGIDKDDAFPGLTQARLDSLDLNYKVINGGLSGETTAGGLSRLDWFLEEKPEIFILELGGNDGLRGIQVSETKKNLEGIITKVQSKFPETKIILAGMQIPPNMGKEYAESFSKIYPEIADNMNVTLIPFLLENVGGVQELNLPDGIHPTEEGHQIVFNTVWPFIEGLI